MTASSLYKTNYYRPRREMFRYVNSIRVRSTNRQKITVM